MTCYTPRLSARWLKSIIFSVAVAQGGLALTGCGEIEGPSDEIVASEAHLLRADETVVSASSLPYDLRMRAATVLARAQLEGALEGAAFGEKSFVYARPDVEGPAYYELEIYQEGEPSGFILLSTGRHDHPVAHWSDQGESLGRQIMAQAEGEVAQLYKLDVLSYAAVDREGRLVASLGNLPQRQRGVAAPEEAEGRIVEHHAVPVASDPEAEEGVRFELEVSGEDDARIEIEPFEDFRALEAEYAEIFAAPLEALRRSAEAEWSDEALIEAYGEGIRHGEIFPLPLLDEAEYEIFGPGLEVVEVDEVEGPGGRRLELRVAEATAEELDLAVVVHHRELGEITHRLFVRPLTEEDMAEQGVDRWSTAYGAVAGTADDQRVYYQHKYNGCAVGCGPVAWSMLFGWGDKKADDNDARWRHRWGLYRADGGYGADDVAPKYQRRGVERMHEELGRRMGTFCVGAQAATLPGDMSKARGYLSGRTGTRLRTQYNIFTIAEGYLRDSAIRSIKYDHAPAIIGTGFVASAHYPLAWKYRRQVRTVRRCFFACWSDHQTRHQFYVNQGWGGGGNSWVPADTWFAGRIYP